MAVSSPFPFPHSSTAIHINFETTFLFGILQCFSLFLTQSYFCKWLGFRVWLPPQSIYKYMDFICCVCLCLIQAMYEQEHYFRNRGYKFFHVVHWLLLLLWSCFSYRNYVRYEKCLIGAEVFTAKSISESEYI